MKEIGLYLGIVLALITLDVLADWWKGRKRMVWLKVSVQGGSHYTVAVDPVREENKMIADAIALGGFWRRDGSAGKNTELFIPWHQVVSVEILEYEGE